jgi:hypothetical protein
MISDFTASFINAAAYILGLWGVLKHFLHDPLRFCI